MALTKAEINRKLLHILSGSIIPVGIFYIPAMGAAPYVPMVILGVILAGLVVVEWLRLKAPAVQKLFYSVAGSALRAEESAKVTGATYIFASAFLCTVLFSEQPHISFMVLSMFILGDAIAAIVGLSMGRIRIGKKSLEGSLACLLLCLVLLVGVFPHVPGLLDVWGGRVPPGLVIVAALSTTVFELVPVRLTKTLVINDNLTVPIVTGLFMKVLYRYCA